jgi:DNA-binding transcriptional MerR regulator
MRELTLLKIGEFSQVGQVSVATLRHYDHCGLLKPNALDPETHYRYYSLDQLARLKRILVFKELGFPLDEITRLLVEDLSLDQLRGMFTLKQSQTQYMIKTEQARLSSIAARLRQIEQEGIMPAYEVLLKQVDPVLVASVRAIIPMGDDLGQSSATIEAYLDQQRVRHSHPAMLLLYSKYEWHENSMAIDVEAAVPMSTVMPGNEQISIRTLPGGWMASTTHIGDDLSIGRALAALYGWMKDNEYQIIDPPRLVRLQHAEHIDPGQYVSEVQFPVKLLKVAEPIM